MIKNASTSRGIHEKIKSKISKSSGTHKSKTKDGFKGNLNKLLEIWKFYLALNS